MISISIMLKSLSEKLGARENMRAVFINAPADLIKIINTDKLDLKKTIAGRFDYIHFFANDQKEFRKTFPGLKKHLKETGMVWVSWPKSGQNETDLSITKVIEIGYQYGLVESKCISLNKVWSALKFTWPKKGKTYNNSYGKLNS